MEVSSFEEDNRNEALTRRKVKTIVEDKEYFFFTESFDVQLQSLKRNLDIFTIFDDNFQLLPFREIYHQFFCSPRFPNIEDY